MPAHMAGAVLPAVPCATNVSQRKAPGAISAIAFMVKPVKPKVGFISGAVLSAMESLSLSCVGGYDGGRERDDRGQASHYAASNSAGSETENSYYGNKCFVCPKWLIGTIKEVRRRRGPDIMVHSFHEDSGILVIARGMASSACGGSAPPSRRRPGRLCARRNGGAGSWAGSGVP